MRPIEAELSIPIFAGAGRSRKIDLSRLFRKEATMANKSLFSSLKSLIPRVTARNDAGGPAYALDAKRKFAGVVLVSDNESWVCKGRPYQYGANGSTGVMAEWKQFVQNQVRIQNGNISRPKLICIDLQPNATTQAPDRSDILNVGGFSDAVFEVVSAFLTSDAGRFVAEVESVML